MQKKKKKERNQSSVDQSSREDLYLTYKVMNSKRVFSFLIWKEWHDNTAGLEIFF